MSDRFQNKNPQDNIKNVFTLDPNGDIAVRVVVTATIPEAPTISSVTGANQQNTIVWSGVAGATDYKLFFDTTAGIDNDDTPIITGSTATEFVHTGLNNGTEYFYKVLAVGPWGNTALSNEDSGTPESYVNVKSVLFDGIDEYINFFDNHNFENNNDFTLSAWIKPTSISGANKCIWAKATDDASVLGWGMYLQSNGAVLLQMRAASQLRSYNTGSSDITTGVWQLLVLTYDGTQNISGARIYIDAVVQPTPATGIVSNTLISTANSQIGRRNSAFPYFGNIDEVTFWDRDLSSVEVTELYNLGIPDDPNNHSAAANLLHWYKMGDGDTFPTILDNEGAVDGTMTNMESGDIVSDVPA